MYWRNNAELQRENQRIRLQHTPSTAEGMTLGHVFSIEGSAMDAAMDVGGCSLPDLFAGAPSQDAAAADTAAAAAP